MRKIGTGILAAVLILIAVTGSAFAAGFGHGCNRTSAGWCGYTNCAYMDADGDGQCDRCGREVGECGYGALYIDENGDGICDRYTAGTGCGRSMGRAGCCR